MTRLRLCGRVAATALAFASLLPGAALAADFVWAAETLPASRFVEADSSSVGEVDSGKQVEVLYVEGERLRVRVSGGTFGWVDKAKTTATPPAVEDEGAAGSEPAPE